MSSFKKRAGTAILSLALIGGLAGFSPIAGATSGYGRHHSRHGRSHDTTLSNVVVQKARVTNNNAVDVGSTNYQTAVSGEVEATDNTTVGSSASGNAANTSSVAASIAVNNADSGAALMEAAVIPPSEPAGMGMASYGSHHGGDTTVTNKAISQVSLTNNNTVDVAVCNDQEAVSGNVMVSGNSTAGNATSGSASNTSSTTLSISVSN